MTATKPVHCQPLCVTKGTDWLSNRRSDYPTMVTALLSLVYRATVTKRGCYRYRNRGLALQNSCLPLKIRFFRYYGSESRALIACMPGRHTIVR